MNVYHICGDTQFDCQKTLHSIVMWTNLDEFIGYWMKLVEQHDLLQQCARNHFESATYQVTTAALNCFLSFTFFPEW